MRDLLGKLTALDPEASETLKVVGYFDALTARGAGLGSLLRAAAALAGAPAVAEVRGKITGYAPEGNRLAEAADRCRGATVDFRLGSVWLVREGEPLANDGMIVERLSVAIETLESRRGSTREVETIVDGERAVPERMTALVRLGIDPGDCLRVIVSDDDPGAGVKWTAPTPTPSGILHSTLEVRRGEAASAGADGSIRDRSHVSARSSGGSEGGVDLAALTGNPRSRVGIGLWGRADAAPESWESALVAHRVLGPGPEQVLDVTEIGGMLLLARAYDPSSPHPDVEALNELDEVSREILHALVVSESIRSAAAKLAMHHSTLQARHERITAALGYDPRSAVGRMRYICAEFLRRLG